MRMRMQRCNVVGSKGEQSEYEADGAIEERTYQTIMLLITWCAASVTYPPLYEWAQSSDP